MGKVTLTGNTFKRYPAVFMALMCAISLLAIIGWIIDQPVLASFHPDYIPMAPASALIFLGVCGSWLIHKLFAYRRWTRRLVWACLLVFLAIVLILAIRYFTGVGPDIEQLISPDPDLFGQFLSARMSPLTALGFFLAIPALLLLTLPSPGKRAKTASAILSLIVYTLSSINVLGYLYSAPLFYGGALIPVALTTALSFLFLSLALLLSAGPSSWPANQFTGSSLRNRMMRTFIPASILIVLFQGFLSSAHEYINVNPAVMVAVAALVAWLIVIALISLIAKNLDADIERSNQSRIKAEKTLKQSEARFRALFEQAAVGVALVETRTGRYIDLNQKYCEFLGYTKKEMLNLGFQDVTDPEYVQENITNNALLLNGKLKEFTIEKRYIHKNGGIVWGQLTASPLWKDGDNPSEYVHIAIVQDITERKRLEEEILSLSLTDELTGLNNRRGFNLLAEQEIKLAYRKKRTLLLFFGDVDNLKLLNDTLGHIQGDQALKDISAILKESFRESDILARVGGDEFVVLALDASEESPEIITQRIQTAVDAHNQREGETCLLSLSFGFARYDPAKPSTVNELIDQADRQMYLQKLAKKEKNR